MPQWTPLIRRPEVKMLELIVGFIAGFVFCVALILWAYHHG
jgi:hypothetical protein